MFLIVFHPRVLIVVGVLFTLALVKRWWTLRRRRRRAARSDDAQVRSRQ